MQSLWSRAAEAHIRSGKACLQATVAPRRHTITVLKGPRRSRFGDAIAAFYTAAPRGFALHGAHYNGARHEELDWKIEPPDHRLAQVRLSSSLVRNQNVDERVPPTDQAGTTTVMRPPLPRDSIRILSSICKMEDALIRHAESQPVLNTFLRLIHKCYDPTQRLGDSSFFRIGPSLDVIAASVEEEDQAGGSIHREPLTNVQFERYHDMMNKLVDSLIMQSYYDEFPSNPEAARLSLQSLDSAWTAIRLLRSEGYPRYNHPDLDQAAAKEGRDHLTGMIRKLFDSWVPNETQPKYQVAKICYNLLVCPVPPTIHHYNALIIGFTRKKMYNLADLVVDSFLYESRLRPTSQTVASLLVHFHRKDDLLGFYGIIRRMMAIDNRGLLLRRRWTEEVLQIPDLRKWAKQPEVTTSIKGNWVIERPMRNRAIYEALVAGLLNFGRVKDAAKVFVASLQEKWGISVELFIQLLRQCLYTVNAPAGDILLRGFIDNAGVITALILRRDCPAKMAEHLYPLLNMGKPPSWPFSEERATLMWHSKSFVTSAADRASLRGLTVAMFIRQTETQLLRINHVIRRIQRIVKIAQTPQDVIDYAEMGLRELESLSSHHRQLAAKLLKHQVLLKTANELEGTTWDVSPRGLALTYQRAERVLETSIPRPARPAGWKQSEHDEQITQLTCQWMRYRLSRMHGIRTEAKRTILDTELALVIAQRLEEEARLILFGVAGSNPADHSTHADKRHPFGEAETPVADAHAGIVGIEPGSRSIWPTDAALRAA